MTFKRATAVMGFSIGHFIQTADGATKTTGVPVCKRMLDGVGAACANAASYNADAAQWEIDLTTADMDGDMVGLSFTLADCLPISFGIKTATKLVSELPTAGSGAITWTYTLTSSVDAAPIAGAAVWATTDTGGSNVVASGVTATDGTVTMYLDAGTYYIWRQLAGWNFTNPDTEVVA